MRDDARRRRPASVIGLAVALAVALTGCTSTQTPDPALTSAVAEAVSAGRSAELGLEQSADGRILPTTLTVLLEDMADSLADTNRELELAQPTGDENVRYRRDALKATRATLEAVHAAQQHEDSAHDELDAALDALDALGQQQ